MLPQDQSAQTRLENDKIRAKANQTVGPASLALNQMTKQKPQQKPTNYDAPLVGEKINPTQQKTPAVQTPTGAQPTGELGKLLRQQAAMQQQQQSQPTSVLQNQIDIEAFLQSPVVQSAVTRTKLTNFFQRYSGDTADYAESVLSQLNGVR